MPFVSDSIVFGSHLTLGSLHGQLKPLIVFHEVLHIQQHLDLLWKPPHLYPLLPRHRIACAGNICHNQRTQNTKGGKEPPLVTAVYPAADFLTDSGKKKQFSVANP